MLNVHEKIFSNKNYKWEMLQYVNAFCAADDASSWDQPTLCNVVDSETELSATDISENNHRNSRKSLPRSQSAERSQSYVGM